jgi:uncharacterized protein with ATP-grasp and redox domains
MKTFLDCYPCFVRQSIEAARLAGLDEGRQHMVVEHVLGVLQQISPTSTPPEIGDQIHRVVREFGGVRDPYAEAKCASTERALALVPRLEALVAQADDSLDCAVRLAIAGNIIDFGVSPSYDLWTTVERVLRQPFAIDDRGTFVDALSRAERVLYLADNAGETVFDRILIEQLGVPVWYAVKSGPVLNDAVAADAVAAGIDQVAQILETGSDAPGTILSRCSPMFRHIYDDASLVIAKGQANYETLSDQGERVFLMLQTKCPVIARDVGVPTGSIVLCRGDSSGA